MGKNLEKPYNIIGNFQGLKSDTVVEACESDMDIIITRKRGAASITFPEKIFLTWKSQVPTML